MMRYDSQRRSRATKFAAGLLVLLLCGSHAAHAQLRIVTYNTSGAPRDDIGIVLQAIGEESRNGIAKPIDVLLLQEQDGPFGDTQAFVNLLNGIYAGQGVTYAHGNQIGGSTSNDRQTIVYRQQTVVLFQEASFGNEGSGDNQQPRETLRYGLRPVGYDEDNSAAEFYAYNSHYKANDDAISANRRNVEATAIRSNYNNLPAGTHAIYAGDHNFYYADSREPAVGTLTAAGPGQAIDPVDRVGDWHNNSSYADVHTQSPCSGNNCVGTNGGMDDRFDFQWVTNELLDGEGLSYIGPTVPGMSGLEHSYHAFGNGGNLCCNGNINSASNTVTFPGVTSYTKQQVLDALWSSSDHLPVVADYQVPAILEAVAGSYPTTVNVGQEFNLELTVSNAADVVAAIGSDELDYSISWEFGAPFLDVDGESYFAQMDMALGGGNTHLIGFDTSTPGVKSGTITVASPPETGTQNPDVTFDILYEVLAATLLYGDYNQDDIVNAADYTMWRDTLGQEITLPNEDPNASPGLVDMDDYDVWIQNFGETLSGSGAGAVGSSAGSTVPEPGAWTLLVVGVCLLSRRVATLEEWTRRK